MVSVTLCLFLVMSISKQAEASKISNTSSLMAPAYVKVYEDCMMSNGTIGVIPDCEAADSGTCRVAKFRRCQEVD